MRRNTLNIRMPLTIVLGLLSLSCSSTKVITAGPSSSSQLKEGQIVRLQKDVLQQGGTLVGEAYVSYGRSNGEGVSVKKYKETPTRWPSLKLVESGTEFSIGTLKPYRSFEYSRYLLPATILTGARKGERVDIGWFVVGDPQQKAPVHLQNKFLVAVPESKND